MEILRWLCTPPTSIIVCLLLLSIGQIGLIFVVNHQRKVIVRLLKEWLHFRGYRL